MGKSLILFLNCLLSILHCCCQSLPANPPLNCNNKHIQDSLIRKYLDSGAEALPNMYNNPKWELYCDSLIALCPNIATAYQHKAIPYIKNGEYAKAFALNDKAVELDPIGYTAYRGFLKCIFTKDYEGAILDFQKAQQLTPGGYEMDHTYKFYGGLCNLELGNYPKAEENLLQDILIQTGGDTLKTIHFNTLLYVGILYYEMRKNDKAKEYLSKCLEAYSELPEANYYLAMLYKREGGKTLEKKYLEAARQAILAKYNMNEDNLYYTNYPHQIKLYEVEKALGN